MLLETLRKAAFYSLAQVNFRLNCCTYIKTLKRVCAAWCEREPGWRGCREKTQTC